MWTQCDECTHFVRLNTHTLTRPLFETIKNSVTNLWFHKDVIILYYILYGPSTEKKYILIAIWPKKNPTVTTIRQVQPAVLLFFYVFNNNNNYIYYVTFLLNDDDGYCHYIVYKHNTCRKLNNILNILTEVCNHILYILYVYVP